MTDIYSFTLAGSPSGIVSYAFEAITVKNPLIPEHLRAIY